MQGQTFKNNLFGNKITNWHKSCYLGIGFSDRHPNVRDTSEWVSNLNNSLIRVIHSS